MSARTSVLVVGGRSDEARRIAAGVVDELTAYAAQLTVHTADGPGDAGAVISSLGPEEPAPMLVVTCDDAVSPDEILAEVVRASRPADPPPHLVVVTERPEVTDVDRALDRGLLDAVIAAPWMTSRLGPRLLNRMDRLRAEQRTAGLTDDPPILEAPVDAAQDLRANEFYGRIRGPRESAVDELVSAIESVLGRRPRIRVPAGVTLARRNSRLEGVYILVEGEVEALLHGRRGGARGLGAGRFPAESTASGAAGPIIGIPGLIGDRAAGYTIRTAADSVLIHLAEEQIATALAATPRVGAAIAVVAVQGLDDRLGLAEEHHRHELELVNELEQERSRLADALDALAEARVELMSQASSAAIGQMAAGLVHELNNPLAALSRARDHMLADLDRLLEGQPHADLVARALESAGGRPPLSTRETRRARRAIAGKVRDAEVVRRLVEVGLDDPEVLDMLGRADVRTARAVAAAAGIGAAARNLDLAVSHIGELTTALRSSMRPLDSEFVRTSVAETVSDALRITAHRMKTIDVETTVADGVPEVAANPGQLTQVWINLLNNSADALTGPSGRPDGRIHVVVEPRTDASGQEVRVRVIDNGPGVPADVRERIFEPRFTSKSGRIRFGLGMGLGISRRIVLDHEGVIDFRSEPGHTEFEVVIPAADEAEERLL